MFASRCRSIAESNWFQNFITGVILFAGALVGIQSYREVVANYDYLIEFLDQIVLAIFVFEVVIKIGAEGNKPLHYFKDSWNLFDFTIIAICLLPVHSQFVAVFRLARILRVLRLITAVPRLQMLVGAILNSIPSIGYIAMLLGLLFYVYAVIGTNLFGAQDSTHFGAVHIALITLFRVVTLDNWTDLMYLEMYGTATPYENPQLAHAASLLMLIGVPLYFISFILIGSMIILNLFIGVILNAMSEMQARQRAEEEKRHKAETRIITMPDASDDLLREIQELKAKLMLIKTLHPPNGDVIHPRSE